MTSPIKTAPAAHSPPKPSPCRARKTNSCSKFCANAQRNLNNEYHRIVICSIFTRPNRSASVPQNQPPSDEISSVTVPISPASPFDNPQSAMTVGITKLYIWTSNASSDQPPKQAPIVRRSRGVRSFIQASMRSSRQPVSPLTSTQASVRQSLSAILDRSAAGASPVLASVMKADQCQRCPPAKP